MAGLLLTGGASRRMGVDKARIRIDGTTLAARIGQLLAAVTAPALEVGPGHSGLARVQELQAGTGPLTALADGVTALSQHRHHGPAIVLSCDLPRLDRTTVRRLADWPGEHSVVPVWAGRPQPLCARWSAADLAAVPAMVQAGERSLRGLLARPDVEITEAFGGSVSDADTPGDLDALGLNWTRP